MAVEKELIHGINAMVNGKEEGFNTLYSYTYNYVYGRAKLIMKNEQDAMDLTQETFIQAYKGIQTLDDVNNVYAWLGSIVYRQGMRIYRKRKNELLVDEEAESIFEDIVSEDKDYSPEDIAEVDATAKIIMDMINELPELQRVAIMAFYYDNMKIDQIADVFECSSNTIKSRLNYAKKTLKEKVEAHEKANRYKLHSLTPAVFVFAGKFLFAEKEFVLAAEATQAVYGGACTSLGFVANPVVAATTAAAATETVTTGATTVAGVETAVTGTATAVETAVAGTATATAGTTAAAGVATATTATTAGITAAATLGTSTAVATGAAVAAKVGLSVGAKFLIGMAATVAVGVFGVGIAASTGHLDLEQVFQQVIMQEEDDDDEDVREEDGNSPEENDGFAVDLDNTEEAEQAEETEMQEESEMAFDSYGDVVEFMLEDEYVVESAAYSEEAVRLVHLLADTKMLDKWTAFDMSMLTKEQRQLFNYTLLNEGFAYEFIPPTSDVVENAPGQILFDTEVLNAYLAAFYEGGNVGEASGNLLFKYEDYTVYCGSDAEDWHTFTDYTIYQYEDYLLISAPCYYMDVDGIHYNEKLYTANVLFKVTENELYPVQMVHVNAQWDDTLIDENQIDENIPLEDIDFSAGIYWGPVGFHGGSYEIEISNEKKYDNYMTFDLKICINTYEEMEREKQEYKEIYCYDVVLQGNTAKFECDKEIYYANAVEYYNNGAYVEQNNGFYGELIALDGGKTLMLTYDVKNDTDGWVLNKSVEPITFGANGHVY